MAEEIIMEVLQEPETPPFYKKRKFILLFALLVFILLLALLSWWLSRGKISSVAARLDTMIYTVGSDFPARIKEIFVMSGDQVQNGQPLGSIQSPEYAGQLQSAAQELANLRKLAGLPQAAGSQDSAGLVEKEAASKLAQARFEEERLQKVYQESVADHVRSQLVMRGLPMNQSSGYMEARNQENAMRLKMEQALENFEKASKFRAALDQALRKIRNAIMQARLSAGITEQTGASNSSPNSFAGDHVLTSPAQGSVFRIDAQPGQVVQPGAPVFYILPFQENSPSDRWIQAWFSPADRDKLETGLPVSIKFPGLNLHLEGKVESIGQSDQELPEALHSDNAVMSSLTQPGETYNRDKFIPVRISINNIDKTNDLKPGIAAECQIQTHYFLGMNWM